VGPSISSCTQPKSTQERCGLASEFVTKRNYRFPILVDSIQNHFQEAFAAWPFRFFVTRDDRIIYRADPNTVNLSYHIEELIPVLRKCLQEES